MKSKLTVTMDAVLIPRAKRHARRQGLSLSGWIEAALRRELQQEEPFSKRWRGGLRMPRHLDARARHILDKHA